MTIERELWTEHTFPLGLSPGWMYNVISRAEDAHIRIAHHCSLLSDDELSEQLGGHWSIKEHIGHLIDLEGLLVHRLKEFEAFKDVLTMADMSNTRTENANHNSKKINTLTDEFRTTRLNSVMFFRSLSDECHQHVSIHPRLKEEMRPVDLLYFFCEHDDHHIQTILELKNRLINDHEQAT